MPYYQCPRCGNMDPYFQTEQVFGNSGSQNYYDSRGSYAGRSSGGVNVRNVRQAYCRHCVSVKMDTYLTAGEKKFLFISALVVAAAILVTWLAISIPRWFENQTTFGQSTPLTATESSGYLVFPSFRAEYFLEPIDGGTTRLHVTEEVVADFPDVGGHRGISRRLPLVAETIGTLNTNVTGVRNGDGSPRPWTSKSDSESLWIESVVDSGSSISGRHTYKIDYTMDNLVREFSSDPGFFGFGKLINGHDWAQEFRRVEVRLVVSAELSDLIQRDSISCSAGIEWDPTTCRISLEEQPNGEVVVNASSNKVLPYHSLAIYLGFFPNL